MRRNWLKVMKSCWPFERFSQFVCVNCAALPESLVESELFGHEKGAFTGAISRRDGAFIRADRGTLFLDEIGDMTLYAQAKLHRALESRRVSRLGGSAEVPVDVRIVAASNLDLKQMIRKGTFRQDLFFRLAVIEITVPPLRSRIADVPLLVRHLAAELGQRVGLEVEVASETVINLLKTYSWPGNIRELKNLIEATLVNCTGPRIEVTDLPDAFFQRHGLPVSGRAGTDRHYTKIGEREQEFGGKAPALVARHVVQKHHQPGNSRFLDASRSHARRARYSVVTAQIPFPDFISWLGVKNQAAPEAMFARFVSARPTEHGKAWVALDPSFKPRRFQPGIAVPLPLFDRNQYLNAPNTQLASHVYLDQFRAVLARINLC